MARAATSTDASGYNGPSKEKFFDLLASYEDHRFSIMRATSLAGKTLAEWERLGGDKQDLKDGYALRKMEPDMQRAELRRQIRVAEWLEIVEEDGGQKNFLKALERKPKTRAIFGGAPVGSPLSLGRAFREGWADGKKRSGPSMQDGIERWNLEADSGEALSYAEGYGEGLMLRPAPKMSAADTDEADENESPDGGEAGEGGDVPPAVAATPKRGRGRPPKSATQEMAERAQAMGPSSLAPPIAALPAPEPTAEVQEPEAGALAGWRGDRDFYEEPPAPVR